MSELKDTVLYIDDEETNLLLFQLTFENDFNVIITPSTIEAREILAREQVKVVVSDLRMPHESGLDFINAVSPQYPDVFYIILTAYLDIDATLKAINQGNTFRYLLKPWDVSQVRNIMKDAIHSYDLTIENRRLYNRIVDRDKLFSNVFYHSSDGIVIYNHSGKILRSNSAFHGIMGHGDEEPMQISEAFRYAGVEDFSSQINPIFNGKLPSVEYQFEISKGVQRYIEINTSLIKYSEETAAISIIRDTTERRLGARKMFNTVIDAEERERNRLASDLHDGIGPILSTIKMYVEWLADKGRSGNSEQILGMAQSSINEAIVQVRNISHNLSPHILEKFGLATGLQSHVDTLAQTTNIEFTLNINIKVRLNKMVEITLYRALKECINNTIKHAQAKNVYIIISQDGNNLSVVYSDNGNGFDMERVNVESKGIGLFNIRNRIESLGGTVDVLSAPNFGTRIKMSIIEQDTI